MWLRQRQYCRNDNQPGIGCKVHRVIYVLEHFQRRAVYFLLFGFRPTSCCCMTDFIGKPRLKRYSRLQMFRCSSIRSFTSFPMNSCSFPSLRLVLLSALVGICRGWDEDYCKACVDDGCTFCAVNGEEYCACGGSLDCDTPTSGSYLATDVTIGCSPRKLIIIGIVLVVFIVTLSVVGCWCCCCRHKRGRTTTPPGETFVVPVVPAVEMNSVAHHPTEGYKATQREFS